MTPTVAAVTRRRTFEVEQQKEEEMTVIESDPEMKRAIMAELEKAAEEQCKCKINRFLSPKCHL